MPILQDFSAFRTPPPPGDFPAKGNIQCRVHVAPSDATKVPMLSLPCPILPTSLAILPPIW